MKLAIVDDLKTDSDRLAGFVHTYMEQHQLKLDALDQFESGESFLSGFTSGSYDLIFLDIYMTGITGMETAKKIRQIDHDCRLIFITTSPGICRGKLRCERRLLPFKADPSGTGLYRS